MGDDIYMRIRACILKNAEVIRKTLPYGVKIYVDDRGYSHPGNLQNNAFQVKQNGQRQWIIRIDENIAPYAAQIDKPGYRTSGYWKNAVEQLIHLIEADLGGSLKEE